MDNKYHRMEEMQVEDADPPPSAFKRFKDRNAQCFCWHIQKRKCVARFVPLDMIQDHTRNRTQNIFSAFLLIYFATTVGISFTSKLPIYDESPAVSGNITFEQGQNVALMVGITSSFKAWGIFLLVSIVGTSIGIPLFVGTATSQHYLLAIVSSITTWLMCALISYFLYQTGEVEYIAILIMKCIVFGGLMAVNVFYSVWALVHMRRDKYASFYDKKLQVYSEHVRVLLAPITQLSSHEIIKKSKVEKMLDGMLTYLPCCQAEEDETSGTVNKRFRKLIQNHFFYPQRFLFSALSSGFVTFYLFVVALQLGKVSQDTLSIPPSTGITYHYSYNYTYPTFNYTNNTFIRVNHTVTLEFTRELNLSTVWGVDWLVGLYKILGVSINPIVITSSLVATFFTAFNWFLMFYTFKKRILGYRRGVYKIAPERRVYSAAQYFGTQFLATIVGWLLLFFFLILSCIVVVLAVYEIRVWYFFRNLVLPSIVTYIVIAIPLALVDMFVLTKSNGELIRNRYLFYIIDLFYMLLQTLRGTWLAIFRALYAFIAIFLQFSRLDMSLLPGESRIFDSGMTAFQGMLFTEHKYNNPVHMVLREIILGEKARSVIAKKTKGDPQDTQFQSKVKLIALLFKNPTLRTSRRRYIQEISNTKAEILKNRDKEDESSYVN